jgi:hypothetical protein
MVFVCVFIFVNLSSLRSGMQSMILNLSCLFSCIMVHDIWCVLMCLKRS